MSQGKYLIIIGSNTDRRRNMAEATRRLRHVFGHCICSRTMTTPAIGMPGSPPFANRCMAVVSSLSPAEVTSICKSIEADLGRKQDDKANGIVRIDIDLAAAGDHLLKPEDCRREYARGFMPTYRDMHAE
ncbi:MAG TPA: 2-amino-4-hydroxy-6-hydroxymethyldihydropteridine diphosphokinase [Candidatus Avibacteroides avistercoris]|uniref:2-amino-4-hydroxy-6-hydroxymethyldihydropteridine pyrophosphokinase n=1 Tax=Candidatus Avibacteroides avistercoris TaxID=2840690 RepID=A0A9D2ZVA9_9BACT|nr:2-amino-4-hydroxy-6-hydroxymethyldihydropteridine diphosphokinase [Candidatus Avibacteroides avistercoris]